MRRHLFVAAPASAFNVRIGEGAVRTQWIAGASTSAPVALVAPANPPGRLEVGLHRGRRALLDDPTCVAVVTSPR
jgi:hypothetical protein